MGTHKIARIASARLNNLLQLYGAYSPLHVCNKPLRELRPRLTASYAR